LETGLYCAPGRSSLRTAITYSPAFAASAAFSRGAAKSRKTRSFNGNNG
jgi:hypothetical protein